MYESVCQALVLLCVYLIVEFDDIFLSIGLIKLVITFSFPLVCLTFPWNNMNYLLLVLHVNTIY